VSSKKRIILITYVVLAVIVLIIGINTLFDPLGLFESLRARRSPPMVTIPILTYHHFIEGGEPSMTISAGMFERQIKALSDAGYTAISFDELSDYVFKGKRLPERPVIITIDDGYLSAYDTAFPILQKYDMKATIFIIGVSHGRSVYRNTNHPITPRFNDAQMIEMVSSGVMSIQSHSYDMHQHEPFETGPYRRGVLRRTDESEAEYIEAFNADFERAAAQIEAMLGARPFVFSYPYGLSNELTDGLLKDMGVEVTLTIKEGVNIVTRDAPESLYSLKRFNVPGDRTPEELLRMLE